MKRRSFLSQAVKLGAAAGMSPVKLLAQQGVASVRTPLWEIKQFKDPGLAHFSYALITGRKIMLIDPARNAQPYYDLAAERQATITGIIETHPHADFVSSHLEIHRTTGAPVYTSSLIRPAYKFTAFDQGDQLSLANDITLRSIHTPGHAPDALSAILNVSGKDVAVFSGDSLLIGDVGRPDLREYSGDVQSRRKELAAAMYHTVWKQFDPLGDDVVLYPAHGAGSLCGKNMRDADSSTIGYEKQHNYAFRPQSEAAFVQSILSDLPTIPEYFPYDVALNVKGAENLPVTLSAIKQYKENYVPGSAALVIDARADELFKSSHHARAVNIPDGGKFETWLGSIVKPEESFFLTAENTVKLQALLKKAAKIGYETKIEGGFVYNAANGRGSASILPAEVAAAESKYTIIDVRTAREAAAQPYFGSAINIPVNELSKRIKEVPVNKPIVIHCASGYRSAIGSSLLERALPGVKIYDVSKQISQQPVIKK